MTPEQAERMASTMNNSRELRMLQAVESIGGSLSLIASILSQISLRMEEEYEQRCGERIGTMSVKDTPEVKVDVECS